MEDIIRAKYQKAENALLNALEKVKETKIEGEEENSELSAVISSLETLSDDLKSGIEELENSSEWNKYCITFFGETNAGKSIIIDTLRIIYDEEQRRAELNSQKQAYIKELEQHTQDYSELIEDLEELRNEFRKREIIRAQHKIRRLPKTLEYLDL